jgi:anti-sigma regulatory factor (Ser/Thr protein kinase)
VSDFAFGAELKVPGDLIYLRPVRSFIRELAKNIGFSHERVSDIELAVDEIFSNAIEHGSAGSRSQIAIHCLSNEELVKITVSDTGRGEGFNTAWVDAWANVVREKTQPGTERGHGLLLARNLTDQMIMESNKMGGLDVHLVVYKEKQKLEQE